MDDIKTKEDITIFVDQFYNQVQSDKLIGPIFLGKMPEGNWSKHLERMYSFWNTVLFGVVDYRGNPFSHHIYLGIEKPHFDRWIALFVKTIDDNFIGPKATEAKDRAGKMRMMFESKLQANKTNSKINPIL